MRKQWKPGPFLFLFFYFLIFLFFYFYFYFYFFVFYFLFFSITSLCQGWQRVQKVASKANNEMHPYYKERVSKVLNTETEHAVVILLGREF